MAYLVIVVRAFDPVEIHFLRQTFWNIRKQFLLDLIPVILVRKSIPIHNWAIL
jgi:hypothetical protein